MHDLGYNYRLTDIQCALGLSQLKRIPQWTARRQDIARRYTTAFANTDVVTPLAVREDVSHAYHLYVIRLNTELLTVPRKEIFQALRAENVGVNVHYIPVHLLPYYQEKFGAMKGSFPIAEQAYEEILSLPMFARMTDDDASDVIEAVTKVCSFYRK
jgi:perosamine synthetase